MRLGADPEVFLCDSAGRHISSIGLIGGDKWNPVQCKGLRKGFTLQEDNVSLEFGIPPAASADEFFENINLVMKQGLKKTGLLFSNMSAVIFPADQMKHPNAFVFGCEPDYNAWTREENTKPIPPHEFMRSAGGHVHVETDKDPVVVSQNMDLYLAVPSVLMDEGGDDRRKMYGKKGAFRPKPYGLEYRVLSNFWTAPGGSEADRKRLCKWVWNATEAALNSKLYVQNLEDALEEAINCGNKNVARDLVKEFNLELA